MKILIVLCLLSLFGCLQTRYTYNITNLNIAARPDAPLKAPFEYIGPGYSVTATQTIELYVEKQQSASTTTTPETAVSLTR